MAFVRSSRRLRGEEPTPPQDIDRCAICLEKPNILAWLDSCSHVFCFDCIREWSRVNNACPQCRERFHRITNRRRKLQVETPSSSLGDSAEEPEDSSDWDPCSYEYETWEVYSSDAETEESSELTEESESTSLLEALEANYSDESE